MGTDASTCFDFASFNDVGLWANQVVPRMVDVALGTEDVSKWRRRCTEGLRGVVVEPGFGSGLNVPHYPAEVTKIFAVDPSELGQKLAAKRIAESAVAIEPVGLTGELLPLDDNSCDAGLLTFTLCTIPDHMAALGELRRVIRPGGTLHFLEHGLSEEASVQRWQRRLTPFQMRLADGCHLDRSIVADIEAAGFGVEWSDSSYAGQPKPVTWFTVGRAQTPD